MGDAGRGQVDESDSGNKNNNGKERAGREGKIGHREAIRTCSVGGFLVGVRGSH